MPVLPCEGAGDCTAELCFRCAGLVPWGEAGGAEPRPPSDEAVEASPPFICTPCFAAGHLGSLHM